MRPSEPAVRKVTVSAVPGRERHENRLKQGYQFVDSPPSLLAELHEGFKLSSGNGNVETKLRAILEAELASLPSEMKKCGKEDMGIRKDQRGMMVNKTGMSLAFLQLIV